MNECYHNSWLAGWMYEGDMNERRSWDRAPQLGQTPRAVETLFFSHPLFCTRSMLTAHSADDIHALCQSHDYAVLLRSQPVGPQKSVETCPDFLKNEIVKNKVPVF